MDLTESADVVTLQFLSLLGERRGKTETEKTLHRRLEPGAPLYQQVEALPHDRQERESALPCHPEQAECRIGFAFQHRQGGIGFGSRRGDKLDFGLRQALFGQQMHQQLLASGSRLRSGRTRYVGL